jgi:hypothetical protein
MPAPTAAATVTPADTAASRDRDEPCNARYRDAINDEAARSASGFLASSSSSSSLLTSSSSSSSSSRSSNRFPRKAPGCL